jgi:hypothetical protein
VLRQTLAYARRRNYVGWDYSDGMSSLLRELLPFDNRWVNLAFQETVKRAPVNVRPLLLVQQRRNYKGTALFAVANLNAEELLDDDDRGRDAPDFAAEARSLVEWLVENRCRGYGGFCGSHQHEVQHLRAKGVPGEPDVVSTSYAVRALLAGERFDPGYAGLARSAADFLVEDLDYREVDDGAKIHYHQNHPDDVYTYNAGALGARLLLDLYARFGDEEYRERATKILDYIADRQRPEGGWTYREPADASHLSMDNHHNGFIVETFQRYATVVDDRYASILDDALSFYRTVLFDPDGAPNWDETSAYPKDIHACAQGILVFTYAGDYDLAGRIVDWTLGNLYAGDGRFYYRKQRVYTKRITLMRWCQAWMAYALSEYLAALAGGAGRQR